MYQSTTRIRQAIHECWLTADPLGGMKRHAAVVTALSLIAVGTVYRPGQIMRFAGFLRRPDRSDEFQAMPAQDVEVQLVSKSKKTIAARLKAKSDEFGRITGDYTFLEADALDTYNLSISGYTGSAELTLAEFRKSKVKLTIDPELVGQTLRLRFRALDFLDKPVPGSTVHYRVQVVPQTGIDATHVLHADEFVFHDGAKIFANSKIATLMTMTGCCRTPAFQPCCL